MGDVCYKHKVATGSLRTSVGRPCDLRNKVDDDAAHDSLSKGPGGEDMPHANKGKGKSRPLSDCVRFGSEQAAALQNDLSPMDKWIGTVEREREIDHKRGEGVRPAPKPQAW